MAIRTINYSVSSDGISPKTEQRAGLQSEHAVTQLVFTLDNTLYQALLDEKQDGDTLVYRFDCIDSTGGTVRTESAELTNSVITFTVGENLTRNGGKARVYLVISRYNAEEETEIEMLSFPARLRFENVPASDNGNSRESLSALAEAAKNAAKRSEQSAESAKQSAAAAAEAQNNAEAVLLAVEEKLDVIDQTYTPDSENAQSGKAVAEAVGEVKSDLTDLAEYAKPK